MLDHSTRIKTNEKWIKQADLCYYWITRRYKHYLGCEVHLCSGGSLWWIPLVVTLSVCVSARCEPISLELCMNLPYNLTSYPNYLGHLSQRESSVSWESSLFPALVQTGCYQYLMFYACTLLVPKCDPLTLQRVPPCRSATS